MRSSLVLSVLLAALTPFAAHAQDGGADTSSPVPSADGAASTDTDDEAEALLGVPPSNAADLKK